MAGAYISWYGHMVNDINYTIYIKIISICLLVAKTFWLQCHDLWLIYIDRVYAIYDFTIKWLQNLVIWGPKNMTPHTLSEGNLGQKGKCNITKTVVTCSKKVHKMFSVTIFNYKYSYVGQSTKNFKYNEFCLISVLGCTKPKYF